MAGARAPDSSEGKANTPKLSRQYESQEEDREGIGIPIVRRVQVDEVPESFVSNEISYLLRHTAVGLIVDGPHSSSRNHVR